MFSYPYPSFPPTSCLYNTHLRTPGTDKFNNKYYENVDLPYGQHRWVEYANIHNPDATMIQPEWHGWMHHVFDETPEEMDALAAKRRIEQTSLHSDANAIFTTHVGKQNPVNDRETTDTSQYRQRGYRVGSLHTGPDDPDDYYLQPGHPLSKNKTGSFKDRKGTEEWDPNA